MTMSTADRYRRWFAYEQDCHAKVLASLREAIPVQGPSPTIQKAIDLLAHLVAARWLWLSRFGASDRRLREIFPIGKTVEELRPALEEMQVAWSEWLARLGDAELSRVFEYQSLEGEWYRNSVEDILTQLFGHSWYHRGQIAQLIRSAGAEPAVTDFVFWTRERINPSS